MRGCGLRTRRGIEIAKLRYPAFTPHAKVLKPCWDRFDREQDGKLDGDGSRRFGNPDIIQDAIAVPPIEDHQLAARAIEHDGVQMPTGRALGRRELGPGLTVPFPSIREPREVLVCTSEQDHALPNTVLGHRVASPRCDAVSPAQEASIAD